MRKPKGRLPVINGTADWKAYFEMLNPSPKKVALLELQRQIKQKKKISPEHLESHGMPETAKLLREAIDAFEKTYKKALEEENLWM